jgi:hypothetical protein
VGDTIVTRLDGPAVEQEVAFDMLRRALPLIPLALLAAAALRGFDGAVSTAFGLVLVLGNLVLAASLLSWTARISLGLMMGTALGGFLVRLAVIFGAVWVVRDASWLDAWSLGTTIIVTHLGLLFWEMRFVSLSLAYPGLKPTVADTPVRPSPAKEHSAP